MSSPSASLLFFSAGIASNSTLLQKPRRMHRSPVASSDPAPVLNCPSARHYVGCHHERPQHSGRRTRVSRHPCAFQNPYRLPRRRRHVGPIFGAVPFGQPRTRNCRHRRSPCKPCITSAMKVLIDECAPKALATFLSKHGHECRAVQEVGWSGKQNGELLNLAEVEFEVLVTLDTNLRYQQNLSHRKIAIIVLQGKANRLEDLESSVLPVCGRTRGNSSRPSSVN